MIRFALYRVRNRHFLSVSKTLAYEVLGKNNLSKTLYKLKNPILIDDDIRITDYIPHRKSVVADSSFEQNIKLCRARYIRFRMSKDPAEAVLLNQAVMACCLYYNRGSGEHYNLKDIAKLIGIKSNKIFYQCLAIGMRKSIRNKARAVASAKAVTIVRSVNNYNSAWTSITGHSKVLDKLYRTDLEIYTNAMKTRALVVGN